MSRRSSPKSNKTIHLWREYVNHEAVAECGAHLTDREVNVKACRVTCAKCMKSAGFRKAALNPFYGVDLKKKKAPKEEVLDDFEEDMFNDR